MFANELLMICGVTIVFWNLLIDWLIDCYLPWLCVGSLKLFYILLASLLFILLARPQLLDGFQCSDDDVVPTKPPFNASTTALFEKHHLKVLSLKNLDKGMFVLVTISVFGNCLHITESIAALFCIFISFISICGPLNFFLFFFS